MSGGRREYADLGAVVHLDGIPSVLKAELPSLYSSAFCTPEYFRIYHDRPEVLRACELREPRHVVVFTVQGATAEVLNRGWSIAPHAFMRAAQAVLRAHPQVRRIRVELDFAPDELTLPVRHLYSERDFVVELPSTPDEWESTLGSSTRHNLHKYHNRLRRQHDDFESRMIEGGAISLELVELAFSWNRASICGRGDRWFYEDEPEAPHRLWRLMQQGGVCLCAELDGKCAGVNLSVVVGDEWWALVTGTDPQYMQEHLGLIMFARLTTSSIERGCRRLHWSWGMPEYKQRLGGRPVSIHRASVFRSQFDRRLYMGERLSRRVWDGHDVRYLSRPWARRHRPGEPRTAIAPFAHDLLLRAVHGPRPWRSRLPQDPSRSL